MLGALLMQVNRSIARTLFLAAMIGLCSSTAQAATVGFADVVVEYFDSGNGSLICPEGQGGSFPPPATSATCVPLSVVLGDDPNYPTEPADYLSLPTGSFVTVGFIDEVIVDGPGDDIFIQEVGDAQELADVYVSSSLSTDPADFVFLGQADGNTISSFDLADIEFTGNVRAVKIISLANGGFPTAPGFDLANVQALEFQETPVPSLGPLGMWALVSSLVAGATWRTFRT